METFDDNSEGKTSIYHPKIMFTKYFISAISFGQKINISNNNVCVNMLPFLIYNIWMLGVFPVQKHFKVECCRLLPTVIRKSNSVVR